MKKVSILIIDDEPYLGELLQDFLRKKGFSANAFTSPEDALKDIEREIPTLVISDINMPNLNGYEVCREIRQRYPGKIVPIILVTGGERQERIRGLEAGADEFLTKPVDESELMARVHSLVRIRQLHDLVEEQAERLEKWASELESRVAAQIQQLGQLKTFFSPNIADLVACSGALNPIQIHRQDITIVFIDLRGFTAFTEKANPKDVISVLSDYYSSVGSLGLSFGGTLGRFMGDGSMIFFNDPEEMKDHQLTAIRLTLSIRNTLAVLKKKWNDMGYQLDSGIGVASGTETIGLMGFDKFLDYSIIGPATNLASRLCDEAKGGEILVSDDFFKSYLKSHFTSKSSGEFNFKGIERSVGVQNIVGEL